MEKTKQQRTKIIQDWQRRIIVYNSQHPEKPVHLVVGNSLVCVGGKFQWLPTQPLTNGE